MELFGEYNQNLERALSEIDEDWEEYPGLIICGSHHPKDVEVLISKIREARESGTPFLGICHGHQLAGIEYARNVLGIKDATSEEFGEGTAVVKKLPELNVGLRNGESYWNNYEVGIDWENPLHFFTTQSHPEYQSSRFNKHPLLVNFINEAKMANKNSKKSRRRFCWDIL